MKLSVKTDDSKEQKNWSEQRTPIFSLNFVREYHFQLGTDQSVKKINFVTLSFI